MKITFIPLENDPRNRRPATSDRANPPTFNEKNFPSLPYKLILNWRQRVRSGVVAGFPGFPELPLEIKEQIIEHAMRAGGHLEARVDVDVMRMRSTRSELPVFLPAICFVSKQMRIEAAPVYIRNVNWVIRSIGANRYLTEF